MYNVWPATVHARYEGDAGHRRLLRKRRAGRESRAYIAFVATLAVRLAVALLGLNVIGAVAAVILDLSAQFGTDAQAGDAVGAEIITVGSATSAPWPPLLALVVGAVLATRNGRAQSVGLVFLVLATLLMIIGVIGEYTSGIPFTGARHAVFVAISVALLLLTAALAATAARALAGRT